MALYHALSQEFNEKTHLQKKTNRIHTYIGILWNYHVIVQPKGMAKPDDVLRIPGSLKPILHQTENSTSCICKACGSDNPPLPKKR